MICIMPYIDSRALDDVVSERERPSSRNSYNIIILCVEYEIEYQAIG